MLLKIDDCWWGQQGKTKISKAALKQIISSKQAKSETNSSKEENTQETLISPRQRMNGLEKCSVCSKMLRDSKEGEVFWLDTCNDYYHVECLRNYIKERLNATEFIISCAKEGCTGTIELKKLQKIMTR